MPRATLGCRIAAMFLKLGLQSVDPEIAGEVAEALIDRLFALDEAELVPGCLEAEYPMLDVLSAALRTAIAEHNQACTADPEYLEALEEGVALGFAALLEVAEVQVLPPAE